MVVNLSLQILPVVEEKKIYPVVDKVIEYIASCGVNYIVGPMETTMEGEMEELLDIVKKAQEICIAEGSSRVVSIIKMDYRPEGIKMDEKIRKYRNNAIEEK